MKILLKNEILNTIKEYESDHIPRVGDHVLDDYIPLPTVRKVVWDLDTKTVHVIIE